MIKFFINLIFCLSLVSPQGVFAAGGSGGKGGSCAQKVLEKCKAMGQAAGSSGGLTGGDGTYGDVRATQNQALTGAAMMGAAASQCQSAAEECAKCPQQEQAQCKQGVQESAGQMQQQSNAMGDAGNMLGSAASMMAGLAPALMAMQQQQQQEEEQQRQRDEQLRQRLQQQYNGALQPNGSVDCSKYDAYLFQVCDERTAMKCKSAMADSRCVQFANRFCNSAAGMGSGYCNYVVAYQFCSGGTKNHCPTCLQMQKESSPICQEHPETEGCLLQNSPEKTERLRASCGDDPVFLGTTGGSMIAQPGQGTPGAPPGNPNLAAPVLASVKGGRAPSVQGMGSNGGIPSPSGTTIVTSSLNSNGREAYRNNPSAGSTPGSGSGGVFNTSSAGGSGGGGYSSSVGGGQGGSGGARRDMAGGGAIGAIHPSSVGPAPDIVGQFGPSLFATSSQVIRSACAAGRFNNCP